MANPLGLIHPSLTLVVGASQSGKSSFCVRVVEQARHVYGVDFKSIIWCYDGGEASAPRQQLADVAGLHFHAGVPTDFTKFPRDSLIILDDCMQDCLNSSAILALATKHCHHLRLSALIVLHNLFYSGKGMRSLSLNANYFVLYKSLRDRTQIDVFFRQFEPDLWKSLSTIYKRHVADTNYGYLLVDLHPASLAPHFRVRRGIFADDTAVEVFCTPAQLANGVSNEAAP